jgi:hypothetical protein
MNRLLGGSLVGLVLLALSAVSTVTAVAQMSEVKEKPPMYSYVGNWTIPRAQWADMDKEYASEAKLLEKAMASGTIVGYGTDVNLVHTPDGETHDDWYSAMSMAALLNVLDGFYKSGTPTVPVLSSATKHSDQVLVSRYYNWHAGSWKDVYTRVGDYKLKPDAPPNALDTLCKSLFVPLLEKLLADGAIHEYEIDTEAIHTDSPNSFMISIVAANAEGLDKFNAAVREWGKSNPLAISAEESMVDFSPHRDLLLRSAANYK